MSDGTLLSNFVHHKKHYLGYMTISNISSKICQMPGMHSVLMATPLPITIMNHNIPQQWLAEQQYTNRDVLREVHGHVLQPLTIK